MKNIKTKQLKRMLFFSFFIALSLFSCEQITPYKYSNTERQQGLPCYHVPSSSQFTIQRPKSKSNIIYYFSRPTQASFPIAILCSGSSSKNDIVSIIHFHRYFLKEFLDVGSAVLTVEQQGVNSTTYDTDEFMKNYTRSARLLDHQLVINHLQQNPPVGWNGKLIFLGVSEGGPLVTTLTNYYSDLTIATINWAGAPGWSWRQELWAFIENLKTTFPWHIKLRMLLPGWMPFSINMPNSEQSFNNIMDETISNPTADKEFMGMTYKYHADALKIYPKPDYHSLKTPFLVVAGEQDTVVYSCDLFVQKAKEANAPITYLRIPDMNHYIRERPDIIVQSFEWLAKLL